MKRDSGAARIVALIALIVVAIGVVFVVAKSYTATDGSRLFTDNQPVCSSADDEYVYFTDQAYTSAPSIAELSQKNAVIVDGTVAQLYQPRFNTTSGARPTGIYTESRKYEFMVYAPAVIVVDKWLKGGDGVSTGIVIPSLGGRLQNVEYESGYIRVGTQEHGVFFAVPYDADDPLWNEPMGQYLANLAETLSTDGKHYFAAVPIEWFGMDEEGVYGYMTGIRLNRDELLEEIERALH